MAKSPAEVWLWLLLVMQPANPKTIYILSQCGFDASRAARAIRDGNYPFLSDGIKQRAAEVRTSSVREVIKLCAEHDISIVTLDDEDYPALLKKTENPPVVLFVMGDISGLDGRLVISAVGTRNVSEYSVNAAEYILAPLAKKGAVIVSGLAVGSDTAAHRAALSVRGRTIGVLGCGSLVNYPKENARLKADMIESGGAVISELLPNTKSSGYYFPTRNRIISGLSVGTLIIEAPEKSGSLLTAEHALAQGRELFCIPPHDVTSKRYSGVIPLLREGAVPVYDYSDIADRCKEYFKNAVDFRTESEELINKPTEKKAPNAKSVKTEPAVFPDDSTAKTENIDSLAPEDAELYRLIVSGDDLDRIMEKCTLDYGELSEKLTDLELCGLLVRSPEGVYSKR